VGYCVRKGTLPKPVTAKNEKRAWNDIDIEHYMTQSQFPKQPKMPETPSRRKLREKYMDAVRAKWGI
jgi:predicted DNA-binding transcriptional regulator AlpA